VADFSWFKMSFLTELAQQRRQSCPGFPSCWKDFEEGWLSYYFWCTEEESRSGSWKELGRFSTTRHFYEAQSDK
jgi:hypothetical protein